MLVVVVRESVLVFGCVVEEYIIVPVQITRLKRTVSSLHHRDLREERELAFTESTEIQTVHPCAIYEKVSESRSHVAW